MMVQQALNPVMEIILVIVDEQLVLDMIVDGQLVVDMIVDTPLVLHMIAVVEEVNIIVIVEELLKTMDDSTPPTRHTEDSVDSDTPDARSTPSDSIAPLAPDHQLTHASPTLVLILRRTASMAVRVPPTMSPGLSASIAEVATMSNSAFHKRFRSSYESSPSSSPPDLPLRNRYRSTFELVEDDDEEEDEDDEEEDKDDEEEDEEDPAAGHEGLAVGDEGPGIRVESLSLGEDEVVPEGQQRATLVVETAVGEPLGLGYGALRRHEIALGEGRMLVYSR
ncbi:hypothetical protein Tco_0759372 [Tanacetum coccineum]